MMEALGSFWSRKPPTPLNPVMSSTRLPSVWIRHTAVDLGFDFCRVTTPRADAVHMAYYRAWLQAQCHGDMAYLERHLDLRANPRHLLTTDGLTVNALVVVGVDYHQLELPAAIRQDPSRGLIARYAWGQDYHELIKPRLHDLDRAIGQMSGRADRAKCWVDTGPVVERDWAMAAGMTFTGKNCCAIHPQAGSWIFLAVLCIPEQVIPDPEPAPLELTVRTPHEILNGLPYREKVGAWSLSHTQGRAAATCGHCTRCLDACPTTAFAGPYMLDARKCISYWTIESRQAVPRDLRPQFGNLIFGCDICQEVCPWNRGLPDRKPRIPGLQARQDWMAPPLLEGFGADTPYWLHDQAFRERFRRSPVKRPKRTGMLRNVCTALGNWGDTAALPGLAQALTDRSPVVREHAVWALGRILARTRAAEARRLLQCQRQTEKHAAVQAEINRWLP